MRGLSPKEIAFLVTNNAELAAGHGEAVEHLLRAVRWLQLFRMNSAVEFVENFSCNLPSHTE